MGFFQERSSDRDRKSRERDRHDMGPPQSSSQHRRSSEPPAEDRGTFIVIYITLGRYAELLLKIDLDINEKNSSKIELKDSSYNSAYQPMKLPKIF